MVDQGDDKDEGKHRNDEDEEVREEENGYRKGGIQDCGQAAQMARKKGKVRGK